ncbi:MAG TPA: AAA family ATPase, partial [Polyangiaceae bacterium]|nr:AAA family ATPase [Polyangiaceae bacterium]
RDIKPSNVQITSDGRVVLLDFGVVGELSDESAQLHSDDPILGTPAYMAPEQARGAQASVASDWYSVGVMMYEALTDHLPFEGSPHELLFGKRELRVLRPSALVEDVPPDLEALCLELLHPDPKLRPGADEVIARLNQGEPSVPRFAPLHGLGSHSLRPFVGRKPQLEQLQSAFAASARGAPVVLMMAGRSGMGKTVLAQHFAGWASKQANTIVLAGRCFEREALPFKGTDSVVDELSRYLTHHVPAEIASALPPGLHFLGRIFPVLRAVPCLSNLPLPEHEIAEPSELRKRAFAALKSLLGALTEHHRLIIHIDDLQWSDIDSLRLLEELLRPPNAPALMLLCGFREEVRASSPVLSAFTAILQRLGSSIDLRELTVAQLLPEEAVELAQLSLTAAVGETSRLAKAIARESQGIPIFVSELSAWQLERQERNDEASAEGSLGVSLEQVIQNRVADLPHQARALLRVLSIANGPLPYWVAEQTAAVPRDDALRARLRTARLVRTFRVANQEFVEAYHARVSDSIVATISSESRREIHRALAHALEASGTADPEALVEQYLGAGDLAHARRHLLDAVHAAEASLAFMRAVRLYRTALEIGVERPRHELLSRLGDALVNAGRSADAADAYRDAAAVAPRDRAIELSRLAAEHYLKGGRDLEGLAELRVVLAAVGLAYPESSNAAFGSLLYHRARLRLRGLSFTQTTVERCAAHDLTRVDVAFSATAGLAMVDVVRGADFGA